MTSSEYSELVDFLGRQFTAIDGQFASVYGRFDAIDRRFDALEEHIDEKFREVFGRLDAIYRRLESLEQEYQAIVQALRRIEGLLADEVVRRELLERGLEELKRHVTILQTRIEELEHRLRG